MTIMTPPLDDPLLLTPGPLTTSAETKRAALRDLGSWDADFIALTADIRDRLLAIAGAADSHVCVPVQGSGTSAVEAALGTLVARDGKALVLVNGAYGARIARTFERMGRDHAVHETDEVTPPDPAEVAARLARDPAISHVAAVHCETTTGLLNPIEQIAEAVAGQGRRLIIDAMSSFGALPLDARRIPYEALVCCANKCLEGIPGLGFAIIRREALAACEGNAHSLSLDLHDQWRELERSGRWRFSPPTHVAAALARALDQFEAEGGIAARGRRYAENYRVLVTGMRGLGFQPLLPEAVQAPIIVSFRTPDDPRFDFDRFYGALKRRGFIIYPGKLTRAETFRIACIGHLFPGDMARAVEAVGAAIDEIGLRVRTAATA